MILVGSRATSRKLRIALLIRLVVRVATTRKLGIALFDSACNLRVADHSSRTFVDA